MYETVEKQSKIVKKILKKNKNLMLVLDYLEKLDLPNFYIASGSVFQTIWNYQDNKDLNYGIKDIDIVYYDKNNLSKEHETKIEYKIIQFIKKENLNYEIDVHNEARMHLWKKENENKDIDQYENSEDAISKWIATVQSIGITKTNGKIEIYAPYGFSDIFSKTIRPIKHKGNSSILYYKKVKTWKERFDKLNIIEW